MMLFILLGVVCLNTSGRNLHTAVPVLLLGLSAFAGSFALGLTWSLYQSFCLGIVVSYIRLYDYSTLCALMVILLEACFKQDARQNIASLMQFSSHYIHMIGNFLIQQASNLIMICTLDMLLKTHLLSSLALCYIDFFNLPWSRMAYTLLHCGTQALIEGLLCSNLLRLASGLEKDLTSPQAAPSEFLSGCATAGVCAFFNISHGPTLAHPAHYVAMYIFFFFTTLRYISMYKNHEEHPAALGVLTAAFTVRNVQNHILNPKYIFSALKKIFFNFETRYLPSQLLFQSIVFAETSKSYRLAYGKTQDEEPRPQPPCIGTP